MKRALVIATFALAFAGSSWAFAQPALAQGPDDQDGLISLLASRFGKSTDEVKAVFSQYRTQRQSERLTDISARLDQAVKEGKLTAAQKQLILDKMAQEQKERSAEQEAWKQSTPAQRQAQMANRRTEMEKHREDMVAWAKTNGIDSEYLPQGRSENGKGRMGETHRGMR